MGKFIDLTDQRFGRLVVQTDHYSKKYGRSTTVYWKCKCDCGNEKYIASNRLRNGNTRSCGCLRKEVASTAKIRQTLVYNEYDLSGSYGIGKCTNSDIEFYFDLEDYDLIKDYKWSYRHGHIITTKKGNRVLLMRNLIMSPESDLTVRYINGRNSFYDLRKSNLEICDLKKFNQNRTIDNELNENLSIQTYIYDYMDLLTNELDDKVVGVCRHTKTGYWFAQIMYKGKLKCNQFKNRNDAIRQRKQWEEEIKNNTF